MGVDLETWCKVVKQHPLKFKFDGLDGFHRKVGDAAASDEKFMKRWFEEINDQDENEVREGIKAWEKTGEVSEEFQRFIDWCQDDGEDEVYDYLDPDDDGAVDPVSPDKAVELFDVDDIRWSYLNWTAPEPQWEWEYLRSKGAEEGLLKKHPPTHVLSHASGCEIPVDEVLFLCPSCGNEPQHEADINLKEFYFYCGLCGCSSESDDFSQWCEDVGVTPYPFDERKREELKKNK